MNEPGLMLILILIVGMLFLPAVYGAAIYFGGYRKPFCSVQEFLMLAVSEAALFRIWLGMYQGSSSVFMFFMLAFMLYGMSVLCMIDYWERIVPNRILLFMLMIWVICMGIYCVYDMNAMLRHMIGVILGLVFCVFSFGFCYLMSKGSMGAGDVKLSILMGIYMTSEYVVGAVLYGCIFSAVFSIVMLLSKKMTRKTSIPFVPFLYLGMVVRYLAG